MKTGGPMVVDSDELKKSIENSGITLIHIANNLGITTQSLKNKVDGKSAFWWHEVITLKKTLRLDDKEFARIFLK